MATVRDLIEAERAKRLGFPEAAPRDTSAMAGEQAGAFHNLDQEAFDPVRENAALFPGGEVPQGDTHPGWASFARALAASPVTYQRRQNASGFEDFLGNLLQSAARGIGASQSADDADKKGFAERQFQLFRDEQKTNMDNLRLTAAERSADRRERMAAIQQAAREKAAAFQQAERERAADERQRIAIDAAFDRQDRQIGAINARFNAGAAGPGGADDLVKSWANRINSNQARLTNVENTRQRPNLRSEVNAYMEANNLTAEPEKLRVIKGDIGKAMNTVAQLEKQLSKIDLADNFLERPVRGTATVYNESRDAFSALVARGLGHVGVLTKEDIKEIRGALPKLGDTTEKAALNFQKIREVFEGAIARQEQALLSPSGGLGPAPVEDWQNDPEILDALGEGR
jgi:hypothetical protein